MKMKTLATLMMLMAFATITSPVFALGPTNAGGIKPVEEWDIPFAPYNDNAGWYSGQWISPYTTGPPIFLPDMGTTIIVEDGVTITVSEIPEATYNEVTGEWEGTHLMWKANARWLIFKFWLNGAGTVTITYDDGTPDEVVTEFIMFMWDLGTGEITLSAYM